MTMTGKTAVRLRRTLSLMALLSATLLSGCAKELQSFDDTFTPTAAEQRFPITVSRQPVRLDLAADARGLSPQDLNRLTGFARAAAGRGATVAIAYPAGVAGARAIANQSAALLAREGVAAQRIRVAERKGKAGPVTLSFTAEVASSPACGDFSRNLTGDFSNTLPPDFGCSIQNNFAAMVSNPQDFVTPQPSKPVEAATRTGAVRRYYGAQSSTAAGF